MKRIIKAFVLLLVVLGAVIACTSIFSAGSFRAADAVALADATLEDDGKEIIETVDFDQTWVLLSGVDYKSDIGTVALRTGTFASDADGFSFITDISSPAGAPFAVFGNTYSLEEYSVVMYDVDVSVSAGYPHEIGMRPVFETASGGWAVLELVRYHQGCFKWFNGPIFKTGIDDTFHYTFIVYPEGRVLIYVDGELLLNAEPYSMFTEDCAQLDGFRITTPAGTSTQENVAKFSNLQVSVFETGYKGAITELLDREYIRLQDCPDSVLYQKK